MTHLTQTVLAADCQQVKLWYVHKHTREKCPAFVNTIHMSSIERNTGKNVQHVHFPSFLKASGINRTVTVISGDTMSGDHRMRYQLYLWLLFWTSDVAGLTGGMTTSCFALQLVCHIMIVNHLDRLVWHSQKYSREMLWTVGLVWECRKSKEFRPSLRSFSVSGRPQGNNISESSGSLHGRRSPAQNGHSGSVCLLVFLERKCLCLIAVDYQTQSLVGQRSSASFLANCTPLVTLSPHECSVHVNPPASARQTLQSTISEARGHERHKDAPL